MGLNRPFASWFIESWSVLDGIAFASTRNEDGESHVCVALMPPDWRAVPIGNASTAWTAGRFGFQEGLFFDDGTEVAFPSLEVIRELIRRAYIAGGIGLADPGAEMQVVEPPEGLDSSGGAAALLDDSEDSPSAQAFAADNAAVLQQALVESLRAIHSGVSASHHTAGPLHERLARRLNLNIWASHLGLTGAPAGGSSAARAALIFRLPGLNAASMGATPAPRSLGDQLLLTLASRKHYGRLADPRQFIAAYAGASLLSAAAVGWGPNLGELAEYSLTWLARQAPRPTLSQVQHLEDLLETLITRIAIYRLTTARQATPPTSTPLRKKPAWRRDDAEPLAGGVAYA